MPSLFNEIICGNADSPDSVKGEYIIFNSTKSNTSVREDTMIQLIIIILFNISACNILSN
jgi:hypothetical protein